MNLIFVVLVLLLLLMKMIILFQYYYMLEPLILMDFLVLMNMDQPKWQINFLFKINSKYRNEINLLLDWYIHHRVVVVLVVSSLTLSLNQMYRCICE
jgi:hypothetical protein